MYSENKHGQSHVFKSEMLQNAMHFSRAVHVTGNKLSQLVSLHAKPEVLVLPEILIIRNRFTGRRTGGRA